MIRSPPGDGVSVRSLREKVATARALEELPNIADAAYRGALSDEQLAPAAKLADPESDREWAARAPNTAPADLAQLARDSAASPRWTRCGPGVRRATWSMWWKKDAGMLSTRGEIPDLDGALVADVFNHMIDQMTPVKGQPWATRAQRGADALGGAVSELCGCACGGDPELAHCRRSAG